MLVSGRVVLYEQLIIMEIKNRISYVSIFIP